MRIILLFLIALVNFSTFSKSVSAQAVDPQQVSISGLSSGAFMAQQVHVTYSDIFSAVGSVAGGPFFCEEGRGPYTTPSDYFAFQEFYDQCLKGVGMNSDKVATFIAKAEELARAGQIAPLENLADDPVFIFHSPDDATVSIKSGEASLDFYSRIFKRYKQELNLQTSNHLKFMSGFQGYPNDYQIAHGMPASSALFDKFVNTTFDNPPCAPKPFKGASEQGGDPYIYNCTKGPNDEVGYDLARDILEHLYGDIATPTPDKPENYFSFPQADFVPDLAERDLNVNGIGDTAFAYVPEACQNGDGNCRLHVALHGCQQYPEHTFEAVSGSQMAGKTVSFGDLFYRNIYNHIAEANDIIMIYPQAIRVKSFFTLPYALNPKGCWGYWPFYNDTKDIQFTRDNYQVKMIALMAEGFKKWDVKLTPVEAN